MYARNPRVERDEHVERLRLAHLADQDAAGSHAQGLLDQAPQRDLTRPLQARLPTLQGDHVAVHDPQLEHLLARHDALPGRDRAGQRIEHRRLASLRGPSDQHIEPDGDRRVEEPCSVRRQRSQGHQVVQVVGAHDVLADVDGPVLAGDVRDHHVQPLAARQRGVDERARQVAPAPGHLEHLLDQIADLTGREDRGGQFGITAPRDEHPSGGVDPDLLDVIVLEVLLQGPEPGHSVDHGLHRGLRVGERRNRAEHRTLVVVGHGVGHQIADALVVAHRIEAAAADQFADLVLQDRDAIHVCPLPDAVTPLSCRR